MQQDRLEVGALGCSSGLLLLANAGRVALFVALFDVLFRFGDGSASLTPLSIVFALALVITSPTLAYVRGRVTKKTEKRAVSMALGMAVGTEGILAFAEAAILSEESQARAVLSGMGMEPLFWVGLVLIGLAPTALSFANLYLIGVLAGGMKRGGTGPKAGQNGNGWPRKCACCHDQGIETWLVKPKEASGHWNAKDHRQWKADNPGKDGYLRA